jgi:class 3 adenylate cyclase
MSGRQVLPIDEESAHAAPSVNRRLTAIMFADAVGYSRLMAEDETWTLEALGEAREMIGGQVAAYGGRVVSTPGDAMLADFGSAVEAVRSAVEIQREFADSAPTSMSGNRLNFRIGLNVGDVVVEDDELLGDGVNIAARVQTLADVGGVCISGTVYDQVRAGIQSVPRKR